jgi:DNA modification methylase
MDKYINQVIQGDCLDVMKELPDKCIDLVLTDPPYGINIGSNGKVGGLSRLGKAQGVRYTRKIMEFKHGMMCPRQKRYLPRYLESAKIK